MNNLSKSIVGLANKTGFRQGDLVRHIPTGEEGCVDSYNLWEGEKIKVLCGGFCLFPSHELEKIKQRPGELIFRNILQEELENGIESRIKEESK